MTILILELMEKLSKIEWVQFGNKWRYYNDDGYYYVGYFHFIDGGSYAFDDDGYMLTGRQKLDGCWYYLSDKGMRLENQWVDGDQYYVDADGMIVTNRWIDNSIYVGADGKKTVNTWEQEDGLYKYKLGDDTYASSKNGFN